MIFFFFWNRSIFLRLDFLAALPSIEGEAQFSHCTEHRLRPTVTMNPTTDIGTTINTTIYHTETKSHPRSSLFSATALGIRVLSYCPAHWVGLLANVHQGALGEKSSHRSLNDPFDPLTMCLLLETDSTLSWAVELRAARLGHGAAGRPQPLQNKARSPRPWRCSGWSSMHFKGLNHVIPGRPIFRPHRVLMALQ